MRLGHMKFKPATDISIERLRLNLNVKDLAYRFDVSPGTVSKVLIHRPTNLKAWAQSWSSYKHDNTAKFLIGICPQGVISCISNAWCGRAGDKYITENCQLLNNLLPGDFILADRGFDISDSSTMLK
eukprot:gene14473-15976_t